MQTRQNFNLRASIDWRRLLHAPKQPFDFASYPHSSVSCTINPFASNHSQEHVPLYLLVELQNTANNCFRTSCFHRQNGRLSHMRPTRQILRNKQSHRLTVPNLPSRYRWRSKTHSITISECASLVNLDQALRCRLLRHSSC